VEFSLNFTLNHPNTHGLSWIYKHPNKALTESLSARESGGQDQAQVRALSANACCASTNLLRSYSPQPLHAGDQGQV
jgi:hypothetical protein